LPLSPARDGPDPDERRKEILWTAISFVVILATWLAIVLVFGYRPLALGMSYDEVVLVTGLGLLLFCSVLYLLGKEREHRYTNRRLLDELHSTILQLNQQVRQLDSLCAASAEVPGSLDLHEVCQRLVEALGATLSADRVGVLLIDREAGRAVYVRHQRRGELWHESPPAETENPWPLTSRADEEKPADVAAEISRLNQQSRLACACFPCKNGLVGVAAAERGEGDEAFSSHDRNVLIAVANMGARAVENAQLHADLRENYLATVRSLVLSLDAHDNYAANHSQRVASVSLRIAEQMGLSESARRELEVFVPLHDVGKIGIPDDVLLKQTSLTDKEKELCLQHCLIGDRIVRPLKPDREAIAIIRNHHESWDGSGYPDGLAGEDIPLLARIVKVADCFDALVSDRPYRPPLSEQEALAHLRLHAGIHYDPVVVQALSAALNHVQRGDGGRSPELASGSSATTHGLRPPRARTARAR